MSDGPALSPRAWSDRTRTITVLTAIVSIPLVVALIALTRTHWSPVLDLAMTEFRVRDVGGRHTPLIGLPGRIGIFPEQGSHPGPLSFYLLAPVYRIFGSTAWSLEFGTVLIHIAAIASALTLAYRRGGRRMCIAMAALLAVILRGYGANVLTQPWNPYLPLIAWMVVLLAVWSLLEGDAVALVFFVVAGTLCAQTHVPYLALVGGLGLMTVVWLIVRERITRLHQSVAMPGIRRWAIVATIAGVVLWLPPIVDQFRHSPGNLSMLSDYFRNPPEQSIGPRHGIQLLFEHFNVLRVIAAALGHSDYFKTTAFTINGSAIPGFVTLLIWAGCAVQAWRMRHRALIHLHAVIAAGLALAVVAMSRIFGVVWYYLTFWAWGLLALTTFAVAWTLFEAARSLRPDNAVLLTRRMLGASVAVLTASSLAFSWSAAHVKPPENYLSVTLGAVVGPTAMALDAHVGAATGHDGVYVVTWSDVAYFGSQGYGLVNELERSGFHVGVTDTFHVPVTRQRVIAPGRATAEIHFATGVYIDEWRAKPGVVEVAFIDPRNTEAQATYESLRTMVKAKLSDLGRDDLAVKLDSNLFGVQLDSAVPRSINVLIDRMLQLGQPTAVFIAPPGTSG